MCSTEDLIRQGERDHAEVLVLRDKVAKLEGELKIVRALHSAPPAEKPGEARHGPDVSCCDPSCPSPECDGLVHAPSASAPTCDTEKETTNG